MTKLEFTDELIWTDGAYRGEEELPTPPAIEFCASHGGHFYALTITDGHASIECEECGEEPISDSYEFVNLGPVAVTCVVDVTHYPANPNRADEYDVDLLIEIEEV